MCWPTYVHMYIAYFIGTCARFSFRFCRASTGWLGFNVVVESVVSANFCIIPLCFFFTFFSGIDLLPSTFSRISILWWPWHFISSISISKVISTKKYRPRKEEGKKEAKDAFTGNRNIYVHIIYVHFYTYHSLSAEIPDDVPYQRSAWRALSVLPAVNLFY